MSYEIHREPWNVAHVCVNTHMHSMTVTVNSIGESMWRAPFARAVPGVSGGAPRNPENDTGALL